MPAQGDSLREVVVQKGTILVREGDVLAVGERFREPKGELCIRLAHGDRLDGATRTLRVRFFGRKGFDGAPCFRSAPVSHQGEYFREAVGTIKMSRVRKFGGKLAFADRKRSTGFASSTTNLARTIRFGETLQEVAGEPKRENFPHLPAQR